MPGDVQMRKTTILLRQNKRKEQALQFKEPLINFTSLPIFLFEDIIYAQVKTICHGRSPLPNIAFAHVTDAGADGFSGGLLHLLTGLDHLAALWCLGALAALMAGSPAKALLWAGGPSGLTYRHYLASALWRVLLLGCGVGH